MVDTAGDPLGMRSIDPFGGYTLPVQLCTQRRQDFLSRAQRTLGFYSTLMIYSDFGKQWAEQQAQQGVYNDTTPMRLKINEHLIQTSYRRIKMLYQGGIPQLTNYIFLMLYGNFETYLSELVHDALVETGSTDPISETIQMMAMMKWPGKFDRITQRFGIQMGKSKRKYAFRHLPMEFVGIPFTDPVDLLQSMADVRHRLVHYSGKMDRNFLRDYPNAKIVEGEFISMSADLPFDLHFYFVKLSDFIDQKFSERFGWNRIEVPPESLP